MVAPLSLVGNVFGQLTVIQKLGRQGTCMQWQCRCSCGTVVAARTDHLRRGSKTSCGCASKIGRPPKHGMHGTRVYKIWETMKQRCLNPKHKSFPDYGGRGIQVSPEWAASFEAFYADMGEPPSPDHTLDRIDNEGPYAAGNCRWATSEVQHNNRRDSKLLTHAGVTRTQAEWSKLTGLSRLAIQQRLLRGWDVARTLTTPPQPQSGGRRKKVSDELPAAGN